MGLDPLSTDSDPNGTTDGDEDYDADGISTAPNLTKRCRLTRIKTKTEMQTLSIKRIQTMTALTLTIPTMTTIPSLMPWTSIQTILITTVCPISKIQTTMARYKRQ